MKKLLSTTTRVEVPFICVDIAGYSFGKYSKKVQTIVNPLDGFSRKVIEYFPNYLTDINITKVNGAVNTYTITLVYAIQDGDDPNKIDKILSNASKTRKAIISYGDYNSPTFIYKEEEAIITAITQQLDVSSSTIRYQINAVSAVKLIAEGNYNFSKVIAKPSDEIKKLLNNRKYGLLEIFYGMQNANLDELIPKDDKRVTIEAKLNISIFDYLNYLVSCMTAKSDLNNSIKNRHKYFLACFDDITGTYGGPYFKITEVKNNLQDITSIASYELDIGFPDVDSVMNFSINTQDAYSILYEYNEQQDRKQYIYRINDNGQYDYITTSPLLKSKDLFVPTESEKTWWSQVTQYPLQASVTIKGLLRPTILTSYLKLNIYFYGRKYNASGIYMITKQEDTISMEGYRTTLTLVRIKGDQL